MDLRTTPLALDDHAGVPFTDNIPGVVLYGTEPVTVRHGQYKLCPCGKHEALVLTLDAPNGLAVADCDKGAHWFHDTTQPEA